MEAPLHAASAISRSSDGVRLVPAAMPFTSLFLQQQKCHSRLHSFAILVCGVRSSRASGSGPPLPPMHTAGFSNIHHAEREHIVGVTCRALRWERRAWPFTRSDTLGTPCSPRTFDERGKRAGAKKARQIRAISGLVGHPGIEPGTSCLSSMRSNQLS